MDGDHGDRQIASLLEFPSSLHHLASVVAGLIEIQRSQVALALSENNLSYHARVRRRPDRDTVDATAE